MPDHPPESFLVRVWRGALIERTDLGGTVHDQGIGEEYLVELARDDARRIVAYSNSLRGHDVVEKLAPDGLNLVPALALPRGPLALPRGQSFGARGLQDQSPDAEHRAETPEHRAETPALTRVGRELQVWVVSPAREIVVSYWLVPA